MCCIPWAPDRSWFREAVQQARCPFGGLFSHILRSPFHEFSCHACVTCPETSAPSNARHGGLAALATCLGTHSPDFCASIARLRLCRHPAKVRAEPLELLRQVRPSFRMQARSIPAQDRKDACDGSAQEKSPFEDDVNGGPVDG